MEKKKMGRPLKNVEPRTKKLTLRLSESELLMIKALSDKLGLSRTDVIILGVERLESRASQRRVD